MPALSRDDVMTFLADATAVASVEALDCETRETLLAAVAAVACHAAERSREAARAATTAAKPYRDAADAARQEHLGPAAQDTLLADAARDFFLVLMRKYQDEKERLARDLVDTNGYDAAAQALSQLTPLQIPGVRFSRRSGWAVTDEARLPREYLAPSSDAIQAAIDAGEVPPGVELRDTFTVALV